MLFLGSLLPIFSPAKANPMTPALGGRDPQGWTPLMSAVSASREAAAAALLAAGAAVDAKNSSGQTALHYAVRPWSQTLLCKV
jgi:ankyrin repeat protein